MRTMHCPICGVRLTLAKRTVDHFIPKKLGGGQGMNRWPMCKRCNNRKGDRMPNAAETAAYEKWLAKEQE